MKKKALWIGFAALAVLLAVLLMWLLAGAGDSAHAWSRRLCSAIDEGDTQAALTLIDEGVQRGFPMDTTEYPPSKMWTLLEQAVQTPLEKAVEARNLEVVRALLERGASARGVESGMPPLWYVLNHPWFAPTDIPIMELLLAYGADFGDLGSPACMAARRSAAHSQLTGEEDTPENAAAGVTEVFRFVARYVNVHERIGTMTVLHTAAQAGNWLLCRVLVEEYGVDVSVRMHNGNTAYDIAYEKGAPEETLALIKPDK